MTTIEAITNADGSKSLPATYLETHPELVGKPSHFDGSNYTFFESVEEYEVFLQALNPE